MEEHNYILAASLMTGLAVFFGAATVRVPGLGFLALMFALSAVSAWTAVFHPQ